VTAIPWLSEPVLDGESGRRGSRLDTELRIDRPKMGIDRATADTEGAGGLPVRQAGRYQTQYLPLSSRQPVMPRSRTHRDG